MKLTIRFADQIVGAFIILGLGILVFVIFMLGSTQRWFSRDYMFKTYFSSASGLSPNMAVQYKGFTIGHVKSIELAEDDRVEVRFSIFDTYIDRVKAGSLVEISGPIGGLLGSQFVFYPGLGKDLIAEGENIPAVNSSEGKKLMAMGLASRPEQDDSINMIINRVNTLLGILNEAMEGTDRTSLGRTLEGIELTVSGVQRVTDVLSEEIENILYGLMAQIDPILENLKEVSAQLADSDGTLMATLGNLKEVTDQLASPEGTVMTVLGPESGVYEELIGSLDAITGTLRNIEKTSDFIPAQLPQLAVILNDLHGALKSAEDVLVALTNNPLLKNGVPEHKETSAGGVHTRNVDF